MKGYAKLLKEGKLVAFPTETVYGLGASIFCEKAIEEIFRLKGRPSDNPLIAHISDLDQIDQIVVDPPEHFFRLAKQFFPGPLTIVLKKAPAVPAIASGGLETLAVRMPNCKIARNLIREVGVPLVAPSANLSGKPSSTKKEHVIGDFGDKIAAVLEGECTFGLESTVITLDPKPTLLRPGQITQEEIEEVLGEKMGVAQVSNHPLSPGMKYRHYAPKARVVVFYSQEELDHYIDTAPSMKRHLFVAKPQTLYHELRSCDAHGCKEAVVLCLSENQALLNRLMKAAQ
ncbi:MAG: Threonylcarbamoyl-AMP synthase [Chlamydiales bacterium]|nr:Threonylcarbamoyl-AMP synthase [Chlamydiales bacterium]MCH9620462.1 Threonylcarbamoyl-AMP synthase [Chlamydiales bacterium]MCH9623448.1 Threonylcarbamoyl-AMP synthase [Chlamydiales bacterium]